MGPLGSLDALISFGDWVLLLFDSGWMVNCCLVDESSSVWLRRGGLGCGVSGLLCGLSGGCEYSGVVDDIFSRFSEIFDFLFDAFQLILYVFFILLE